MFLRKRVLVKFDGKKIFLLMSSETGNRTQDFIYFALIKCMIYKSFELTTTVKVSDE